MQQYKAAFTTSMSFKSNYSREKLQYVTATDHLNLFFTITGIKTDKYEQFH